MVGLSGQLSRQPVGLGSEQPCRRCCEFGVIERQFTVHRGGQHLQPGGLQRDDGGTHIRCDDDRYGEDAARRSTQAFTVVRVDAVSAEDHRRRAHGIGDADQCARVARLADFHADGDEPGRAGQNIVQTGTWQLADRHQAGRSHGVRQGFCSTLSDEVDRCVLAGETEWRTAARPPR